jgi:membrane protease YdiL (CAAX protease family)
MSTNSEWPQGVPPAPPPVPASDLATSQSSSENPPWNGWDVLRIALLMFVVPYLIIPIVALVVQKIFFPGISIIVVAQKPWVALTTQFAWYLVVLAYMVMFVEGRLHQPFWTAIRWQWPRRYWPGLVVLGMSLVSLQVFERFFHLPKHIPLEDFLSTPLAAVLTAIFAVSLGPLMEELFFRGFLYPVIERRFGIGAAIIITAVAFGTIHAAQLAFAGGLVLIIFLVGIVLTIVRAKTGSVAASLIVHVAYNSTLVIVGVIASHHWHL